MNQIEIFLLAWEAYRQKQRTIEGLGPFYGYRINPAPPSHAEIMQLINECEPKAKAPPFELHEMKEYPIG